jgi:hypothetical protein
MKVIEKPWLKNCNANQIIFMESNLTWMDIAILIGQLWFD